MEPSRSQEADFHRVEEAFADEPRMRTLGVNIVRILVVEDEPSMQTALHRGLVKSGYAVDTADDGRQALELLDIYPYDGVLLDINLPHVDGFALLKQIRDQYPELRVLILSARTDVADKVAGLDGGASDYMEKPFHFQELEARLRALLRRAFVQRDRSLVRGGIRLEPASKRVTANGQAVHLTNKEYAILEYLLMNADRIVSAEELIDHIWSSDTALFSNALKVHVHTLKSKMADQTGSQFLIKNVRGMGYFIAGE